MQSGRTEEEEVTPTFSNSRSKENLFEFPLYIILKYKALSKMAHSVDMNVTMNASQVEDIEFITYLTAAELRIGSAVITGIGFIANSLIIIVILLGSLRKSPFMILLMVLATVDNIYILSSLFLLPGIFDLFGSSLTQCRLTWFVVTASGIMSSWLLVLIATERFTAVFHPLKVHIYFTLKRTSIMILVLTILSSISSAYLFFTCSVQMENGIPVCAIFGINRHFDLIFQIMLYTLYCILPFILITVLNLSTIWKLRSQNDLRMRLQGQSSNQKTLISQVTMMVAICFVFVITTFPITSFMVVQTVCMLIHGSPCYTIGSLVMLLMIFLEQSNHSVNFFMYCMTGSTFRAAFFHIIWDKCKRKGPQRNPEIGLSISENTL